MAILAPIGAVPIEQMRSDFQLFTARNVELFSEWYRRSAPALQLQKCRSYLRDVEKDTDARCKAHLARLTTDFDEQNSRVQKASTKLFRKKKIRFLFKEEQKFLHAEQVSLYGRIVNYTIFLKTIEGLFAKDRFAAVFINQAVSPDKAQWGLICNEGTQSNDEFFQYGLPSGQKKHEYSPFGVFARYVLKHSEKLVKELFEKHKLSLEPSDPRLDPKALSSIPSADKDLLFVHFLREAAWAMARFKASSVDQLTTELKEIGALSSDPQPQTATPSSEKLTEEFKTRLRAVTTQVDLHKTLMQQEGLFESTTVKIMPLPPEVVLNERRIRRLNDLVRLFFKEIANCVVQLGRVQALFEVNQEGAVMTGLKALSISDAKPLLPNFSASIEVTKQIFAKISELQLLARVPSEQKSTPELAAQVEDTAGATGSPVTVDSVSYLPLSLIQQECLVSFFEGQSNLLWALSDALPEEEKVFARELYNSFEEAEDQRYNKTAEGQLKKGNTEFKDNCRKNKSKNLKAYREAKDRSALQIEAVVFEKEVKARYDVSLLMDVDLLQDNGSFTQDRWLKIFLSRNGVPEEERKSLSKKILKGCTDIEIFQEDHGIGGTGNRSFFGKYCNAVVGHLERQAKELFQKYALKLERGKMAQIRPFLDTMSTEECQLAVRVLFKQALTEVYCNTHFFLQGGCAKIAKLCDREFRKVELRNQPPEQVSRIMQAMATAMKDVEVAAKAKTPPLDVSQIDDPTKSVINSLSKEFLNQLQNASLALQDFLFILNLKNAHHQYALLFQMSATIIERMLKTQEPTEACTIS